MIAIKKMRIQKLLSQLGYGSRRQIESWIQSGRIKVNHRVATLGESISTEDAIYLDGKRCTLSTHHAAQQKTRLLLYHKPRGIVCTRQDEKGRLTVFDALPPIRLGRWIHVGRLDLNTSGLLLFTNDGDWAHQLTHPSKKIEREYAVRILGSVNTAMVKRLVQGVKLDDGMARFEDVVDSGGSGANRWFHVVVTEGRNRLVRRLWESQGVKVSRLSRVRFGPIMLPRSLSPGSWMELDPKRSFVDAL